MGDALRGYRSLHRILDLCHPDKSGQIYNEDVGVGWDPRNVLCLQGREATWEGTSARQDEPHAPQEPQEAPGEPGPTGLTTCARPYPRLSKGKPDSGKKKEQERGRKSNKSGALGPKVLQGTSV